MNINPVLMCSRCRAATLHIFLDRRPQQRHLGETAFVDVIYECDACGAVRAWGNEPREVTTHGRRLTAAAFTHAVDVHGMRRQICTECRGTGLDCSECDDDGQVWVLGTHEPCGPSCPIAGLEPPVSG